MAQLDLKRPPFLFSRSWRHQDTCHYKTILVADVPRVGCKEHCVVTMSVSWVEPGSGFTEMFEALVIDCLKERHPPWWFLE